MRKHKPKASASGDGAPAAPAALLAQPAGQAALGALAALQSAVASVLGALQAATQLALDEAAPPAAAVTAAHAVLQALDEGTGCMEALAGWEQRLDVESVLAGLLKEQHGVLHEVQLAASKLGAQVLGLSW